MKDIVFGVLGGLVGAAAWAGVAIVTGYEVGWIAWGIGALVGYSVALGNKDRSRSPTAAGVIAVAITALSISAGKYAAIQLTMPSDAELVEMFTQGFAEEEYVISFLADEVVGEYAAAERPVEWPADVDPAQASGQADYPADVWSEAASRWGAMSESEQASFREEREAESRANIEASLPEIRAAISAGGFFSSFTPMDLLFFGLGMVTAWGVGSGRKSQQEVTATYRGALILSMLRVASADGEVSDDEIETIRAVLKEALGTEVEAAVVREEAKKIRGDATDVIASLTSLSPHLDNAQRELAVRSAVQVAIADGSFGPEEQRIIQGVAKALDVSDAHLRGIVSHLRRDS